MAIDAYEHDNSRAQANPIQNGETQSHNIAPVGDVDWVEFTLFEVSDIILETSSDIDGDTAMWLYDEDDNPKGYDDDYGNGRYSRIMLSNIAPGTYYLKIKSSNDCVIEKYSISFHIYAPQQAGLSMVICGDKPACSQMTIVTVRCSL